MHMSATVCGHGATIKLHWQVAEVFECIEAMEEVDRCRTRWFGGIDTQHVHFDMLLSDCHSIGEYHVIYNRH